MVVFEEQRNCTWLGADCSGRHVKLCPFLFEHDARLEMTYIGSTGIDHCSLCLE